ncbi:MAG: molybdopterin-binding protein [Nitrospinota bacterium]|nr:molybdopterin-binding protein [Nitrospinota bacterium]HJM43051.1 molybdopterin-binding protein [Nitrospinota bacterium]
MFTVETVAIGSEILTGQVLGTNTRWLCAQVAGMGGAVERAHIVADSTADIAEVLRSCLRRRPSSIITCGGLGPTADDMTLFAVAGALSREMTLHPEAKEWVRKRYQDLAEAGAVDSAEMTPAREKMACLPAGAEPLPNRVGAAPGVRCPAEDSEVICLPGVPAEMRGIFEESPSPLWRKRFGAAGFAMREAWTDCGDESVLAPLLHRVADEHSRVYIKSRAGAFGPDAQIPLTLSASAPAHAEAASQVEAALEALREMLEGIGVRVLDEPESPQTASGRPTAMPSDRVNPVSSSLAPGDVTRDGPHPESANLEDFQPGRFQQLREAENPRKGLQRAAKPEVVLPAPFGEIRKEGKEPPQVREDDGAQRPPLGARQLQGNEKPPGAQHPRGLPQGGGQVDDVAQTEADRRQVERPVAKKGQVRRVPPQPGRLRTRAAGPLHGHADHRLAKVQPHQPGVLTQEFPEKENVVARPATKIQSADWPAVGPIGQVSRRPPEGLPSPGPVPPARDETIGQIIVGGDARKEAPDVRRLLRSGQFFGRRHPTLL